MVGAGVELLEKMEGKMYRHTYAVLLLVTLIVFSGSSISQDESTEQTTFDQFTKAYSGPGSGVGLDIYVSDQKQYLANHNEKYWENIDGNDTESERIGDFIFSPTQRISVIQTGLLVRCLEIRDAANDKLLLDGLCDNSKLSLLFNGWGVLYIKSRPDTICSGSGKESVTQKYQLQNGKIQEVKQPMRFWENVYTELTENLILYSTQEKTSSRVAKLNKGAKVQVLTFDDGWFLIKTPLGLTGWVYGSPTPFSYTLGCG